MIKAGDVQRMTAGTGIVHAEMNPSKTEESYLLLLQIWLKPSVKGLSPSYEDKHIDLARKLNRWCLIASNDAREDSLLIHQDVSLWATYLEADKTLAYHVPQDRSLYIQVAKGEVSINGILLAQGDALAVEEAPEIITLKAEDNTEVFIFDLPKH